MDPVRPEQYTVGVVVPVDGLHTSAAQFRVMACTYFGLQHPQVAALGALPIPCRHGTRGRDRISDRFGVQLGLAMLPGGDWDSCHDAFERVVLADVRSAGIDMVSQPTQIFAGVVPPAAAQGPGRPTSIVPDMLGRGLRFADGYQRLRPGAPRPPPRYADRARDHMFDVKGIHRGGPSYSSASARDIRCGAVEDRAHGVHLAYRTHARHADARFHAGRPGTAGPVETRLGEYPPVHGLVFGAYGEWSSGVEQLLHQTCAGIADRRWRAMAARSRQEALGIVTAQVRCRWGIAACRAQADLTIRRITWVGAPREGPRRHAGATAAELEAVEAICLDHLEGGGVHGGPEWARTTSG